MMAGSINNSFNEVIMRLNININLDNDAFQDGNLVEELQRILCTVCIGTDSACTFDERFEKSLKDTNGNIVGKASVSTLSPSDIS